MIFEVATHYFQQIYIFCRNFFKKPIFLKHFFVQKSYNSFNYKIIKYM